MKLHDQNYYDQLHGDPSEETKVRIQEWTDRYKERDSIDNDVHAYVTDLEDTKATKTNL